MNADPLWTTGGSWTMGRDPLGLQATSIRLYQGLVPDITNITNRLRYYSYFPWIIRLYEQTEHSESLSKWARFIRRADALYALASMVADFQHSDGLGGWDWANAHRQSAAEHGIDLSRFADDPHSDSSYLQAARGTFGNAYAPTFIDLGLITATPVPITIGRGNELADAFAQSIGAAADVICETLKLSSGHVGAAELQLIGEAIHPSQIPEDSDELRLLREFLSGAWDEAHAEARRSTAWLLLDAYRLGVTPGDTDALRALWYDRRLPGGAPYLQTGTTIDRWRAYQANEYCHIALECLLNGLVGAQHEDHIDGIEPRRLVAEVVAHALPDYEGTWAEWALGVADEESAEQELGSRVLEVIRQPKRPAAIELNDAMRLLARLWVRWSGSEEGVRAIISVTAGRGGRSLDSVFRTLDENADYSVHEAAAALVQRHIVIDHQTIAGHKLSAAGTFTYHFLVADGLLTDGEIGAYAYTTPRLGNFTRLLRDAKLIDGNAVTTDGEAFLEQNQPL